MHFLICSDGSAQAERAMRVGALLAAGCEAEVTLLGIIETPGKPDQILESLKRGQALLADKKIQAEMATKAGDPIAEIVRRTEQVHYDLVVIGAVRKEARGPFWMSSKSYKIIKEIKPPVLSVAGKSGAIKRIILCSGGKSYIDNAVSLTGRLARGIGATVTLLHVMPDLPAIYSSLPLMAVTSDALLSSGSELGVNLRSEKQALEAQGVTTNVVLRHGPVLEEILREIHTGTYDLVVTGSALSRNLRSYVLGDVSREIVNRTTCAVLVVRSQIPVPGRPGLRRWFNRLAPP